MSLIRRALSPVVDVRKEEASTLLLMFLYSFLVMTSYSIVKPLTRAQFINDLGADNLPWVLLGAGVLIGVTALLACFWGLFQMGLAWAPIAFYFVGQIMGLLLISHFWTLANDIYDPRQAKRPFGFIGGGASLGGMAGSALLTLFVTRVGSSSPRLASRSFQESPLGSGHRRPAPRCSGRQLPRGEARARVPNRASHNSARVNRDLLRGNSNSSRETVQVDGRVGGRLQAQGSPLSSGGASGRYCASNNATTTPSESRNSRRPSTTRHDRVSDRACLSACSVSIPEEQTMRVEMSGPKVSAGLSSP